MWKVTGYEDVSRFFAKSFANPFRRIVGLKITRRRQLCERVARAPERLGRLLRAQLAAVPHHGGLRPSRGSERGDPIDSGTASIRERTPEIDAGPERVTVVNQKEIHLQAAVI
jgi:hypothetical protein